MFSVLLVLFTILKIEVYSLYKKWTIQFQFIDVQLIRKEVISICLLPNQKVAVDGVLMELHLELPYYILKWNLFIDFTGKIMLDGFFNIKLHPKIKDLRIGKMMDPHSMHFWNKYRAQFQYTSIISIKTMDKGFIIALMTKQVKDG